MPQKLTFQTVKSFIETENYQLLSTEYKNNRQKLHVRCPSGHQYDVKYNDFQQGMRCPVCFGTPRHTYGFVKQTIEKENYQLLSTKYINNKSLLSVRCKQGHIYSTSYSNFNRGWRCPICSGKAKHKYDDIKNVMARENYQLLSSEYVNSHSLLMVRCPRDHEYKVRYGCFQQGQRCPHCISVVSKAEKEILQYIKSIYSGLVVENDRSQVINPKTGRYLELDIWLPELRKAIEYNGYYWHSDEYVKYKDLVKVEYCQNNSIDLLVICEETWNKEFSLLDAFLE